MAVWQYGTHDDCNVLDWCERGSRTTRSIVLSSLTFEIPCARLQTIPTDSLTML